MKIYTRQKITEIQKIKIMKYYKMPRKYSTIRKFKGKCERCEKQISEKEAFCYVDGNNIAISYNSPYLCKQCYEKKYGGPMKYDINRNNNRYTVHFNS